MDFTEFHAENNLYNYDVDIQDRQPKYSSLSSGDYDDSDCAVFRSVSVLASQPGLAHFGFKPVNVAETPKFGTLQKEKLSFKSDTSTLEKTVIPPSQTDLPPRMCFSALSPCHVYVDLVRQSLCNIVETVLDRYDRKVDFEFNGTNNSWDMTLYSDALEETVASLCMYSTANSNILLEFRKLRGCAFTSCTLFRHLKSILVEKNVVRDSSGNIVDESVSGKNVFGLGSICKSKTNSEILFESSLTEDSLEGETFDEPDYDDLFDMYFHLASSKCLDTRMEGYRLIASELVGADKVTVDKFIKSVIPEHASAISFLTKSCQSNVNGVCRYAVTALAEISSHSEYHPQLKEANAVQIVSSLYGYQHIVPEIKRQVKTVLTNLVGEKIRAQ